MQKETISCLSGSVCLSARVCSHVRVLVCACSHRMYVQVGRRTWVLILTFYRVRDTALNMPRRGPGSLPPQSTETFHLSTG